MADRVLVAISKYYKHMSWKLAHWKLLKLLARL